MASEHLAKRPLTVTSTLVLAGLLLGACGGGEETQVIGGTESGAGASEDGDTGAGPGASLMDSPSSESPGSTPSQADVAVAGANAGPSSDGESAASNELLIDPQADPLTGDVSKLDEPVAELILKARSVVDLDPSDAARWRDLGHTYQANRIPSLAIASYSKALDYAPDNARTWYQMALAQDMSGNTDAAMTAIDAALDRDDTVCAHHWRRASWLFDLGQIDEAAKGFEAALAIDPEDAAAVAGMARVQMERDDLEPAIESLSRVLAASAQMPFANYVRRLLATAYRRSGEDERAGALEALGTDGPPIWYDPAEIEVGRFAAQTIFHRAALAADLANRKEYEQAIVEMRAVVEDNPDEAARRNQLARFLDLAGRRDEAVAEYRESLRRSPSDREALVQLGKLLGQSDKQEEGIALIDKAIEIQPLYPPAHFFRGSILRRMGRIEEAAASYRRSVELDETKKTPWVAVGLLELELQKWESSLQAFNRALELGLDRGDVWLGKAECLLQLRRLDEADEALQGGRMKQPFDTQRWMGVSVAVQNERRRMKAAESSAAGGSPTPVEDGSGEGNSGQ